MRRVDPKSVIKASCLSIKRPRENKSKEDKLITVSGDGLKPHLDSIMMDVFKSIRADISIKSENKPKENTHQKIKLGAIFTLEHWRGDKLLRTVVEENLCPDEFINHMLDVGLSGGTAITSWYVLLFSDNHTPAAGNTYATPGFTESTAYDEATRPAWSEAGVSSKVITNSASKATFTMTGVDTSIYGAALVGGGSAANTKGNTAGGGTLGPLAQFTGGAVTGIVDDDVLKVYVTITGSDV